MRPPENMTAALDYAAEGWAVLPVRESGPGAKAPYVRRGKNDATTAPEVIEGWWRTWPRALVAIALPPGIVVIDIDPRHGGRLQWLIDTAGPEGATMLAHTGGGGWHAYYRAPKLDPGQRLRGHPITPDTGEPVPGVDVRAGGKHYVIAPPSLHPVTGAPYRWVKNPRPIAPLPPRLAAAIITTPKPALRSCSFTPPGPGWSRLGGYVDTLATKLAALAACPQGSRNETAFTTACYVIGSSLGAHGARIDVEADLNAVADAAAASGLNHGEITRVIESARNQYTRKGA